MLHIHNTDAIRRIESAIGYTFRDKRLLVQVFTRKTYMKVDPEAPDNEVLEFYGDTLLSYHVTTYFVDKFAHMLPDGLYFMRTVEQFTEMRSHYVRNQYLTERIKALIPDIDKLVRAQNPKTEMPKDNQKAYADLFESLIGAVYLDSLQDTAFIRAFILHHLNIEPLASLPVIPTIDDPTEDEPVQVTGRSRKAAEPIIPPPAIPDPETLPAVSPKADVPAPVETAGETASLPSVIDTRVSLAVISAQDELAAFCRANGYDAPTFLQAEPNAPNARPVAACSVTFRNERGKLARISLNDSGKTPDEAEAKVAAKMLAKLKERSEAPVTGESATPVAVTPVAAVPPTDAETVTPTLHDVKAVDVEAKAVADAQVKDTVLAVADTPAPVSPAEDTVIEIPAAVSEGPAPAPKSRTRKTTAKKDTAGTRKKAAPPAQSSSAAVDAPADMPAPAPAVVLPVEDAPIPSAGPAPKTRGRKKATPAVPVSDVVEVEPVLVSTDEPTPPPEVEAPKRTARRAPRGKKAAGE